MGDAVLSAQGQSKRLCKRSAFEVRGKLQELSGIPAERTQLGTRV